MERAAETCGKYRNIAARYPTLSEGAAAEEQAPKVCRSTGRTTVAPYFLWLYRLPKTEPWSMSRVAAVDVGAEKSAGPYREMSRILDRPPVPKAERLTGGTRLTGRWTHGPVHDRLPAMPAHTICAIYGGDSEITLSRAGKVQQRSQTRGGSIVLIPTDHDGRWDIVGATETSHVYLTPERLQSGAEALTGRRPIELLDRVCYADPTITRILAVLSDEASKLPASTDSRLLGRET